MWAKSWANFGVKKNKNAAELGDILTFSRDGGGHVGFYVGEDSECFHVLGGNQGDAVSIVRISKDRLFSVNAPKYNNKPANVRKIYLTSDGKVSSNEQ